MCVCACVRVCRTSTEEEEGRGGSRIEADTGGLQGCLEKRYRMQAGGGGREEEEGRGGKGAVRGMWGVSGVSGGQCSPVPVQVQPTYTEGGGR